MGPLPLKEKIRHSLYEMILPIYLWSIGYKTLEAYIKDIEWQYEHYHRSLPTEDVIDDNKTI